ncbi:DUF2808 domain-containing protein [Synechococcus sp. RSCCF101]|uniref:DUF2808 domain-containing protein n=1 Tax=Synechococcus sp. RSCCF101 TaxID=2511069 RepID=UPI001246D757|nr:DUF2808 domain-containing protein [Synechococcus sp. RSCCF101]QEY30923.1 DUF2808 domain-containing protein [Synechococcus sp. RSCCF101]
MRSSLHRHRSPSSWWRRLALGLGALGLATVAPITAPAALAQGTPSLFEFRWDNNRDYRKLYYFSTSTNRRDRADYYLVLKEKDRKTAILKLTVTVPDYFDAKIDPENLKLCRMQLGGMLSRTRCLEELPAVFEVNESGSAIEMFPETPIPDEGTIGIVMRIFNPSDSGMFQFNALAQAPGDVPMAGYLGSWLIQIDP